MDNEPGQLHERVEVLATYGLAPGQQCVPRRFKRASGQTITITELGLRHPTHRGSRTVHVFDVTDGARENRLEFDSERLTWWLPREPMYGQ